MNKPNLEQEEKKVYRKDVDEAEARAFELSLRKIEDMDTEDIKSEIDDVAEKLSSHARENGLRITILGPVMMGRFVALHDELKKRGVER